MRNVLFSQKATALRLDDLAFAAFVRTNGLRATAERQMRLEFVGDHLLDRATLITAQQNHVIKLGGHSAASPAFTRRDTW
jgi:hypothetical protein